VTLLVFAKAILIAICAALAAWAYFVMSSNIDGFSPRASGMSAERAGGALMMTLFGSFTIGLPVALLTFLLSWRHLANSPTTLAMVTVLAGIMMVITSYAIGKETGVLILGIPAFLAALTYGILGWFWVLKPLRNSPQPPPQENGSI